MISSTSLLTAYQKNLSDGLSVLDSLNEYNENFSIEAYLILNAKCYLLNNKTLDDFELPGYFIEVYKSDDGYEIIIEDLIFELEIVDDMITSYKVNSLMIQ